MGGAATAVAKDPWALRANPSLAAWLDGRSFSVAHSPSWLGIPELGRSAFVYVEPTSFGVFACGGARFGIPLYRETDLSVTFASVVSDRLGYGVSVQAFFLTIERYGSARTIGITGGFSYAFSEEVLFGCSARNLNAPRLGVSREKLPQSFAFGLEYRPLRGITLDADAVREIGFPFEAHIGFACELAGCLSIMAGASDQPSTYSTGLGVSFGYLQIDYGLTAHPDLGISHHFSISLYLGAL